MNSRHNPKFIYAPILPVGEIKPRKKISERMTWGDIAAMWSMLVIFFVDARILGLI